MKRKRGRMTAEELMKQLAADPEYVARQQKERLRIAHVGAELARAEAPLVRELRAAGADVASVWDLVNTKQRYPELVPILLDHLDGDYPVRIREGIARALAVPDARIGWRKLVGLYEARESDEMKWSLHLAIAAAADVSILDDLIRLSVDRRHGQHRSFFVDALAAMNDPRAKAALEEVVADPDLSDAFERLSKKRKKRRS